MTEAAHRADFSKVRYAQVWEDADILVEALKPGPGKVCLSIASAGDNALALLSEAPERVFAIDLNPAQLHCLALRVAAFRRLDYPELLELIGSRPSTRRARYYQACRPSLDAEARAFWDARPEAIDAGIGSAGKFERYFALFRNRVLPCIHSSRRIRTLLDPKRRDERIDFYERHWNNRRWRCLFRLFFSRAAMGRLGRDPSFFKYVEGSVADRILARTRHALTELEPAENPYLQWILLGRHASALPCYLRESRYEAIRTNLDRLEWRRCTVEEFLETRHTPIDAVNLSDIFEYMSESNSESLLRALAAAGRPGARLAYWNMLAPRSRPDSLADRLLPCEAEAEELFRKDKAFFYSRFVIEEVRQ